MASISTILTLVTKSIKYEIVTERAEHELIELPLNKFVAVHFVNFTLTFPYSALTSKTSEGTIQRTLPNIFLDFHEVVSAVIEPGIETTY